jgi:hypothetical protein
MLASGMSLAQPKATPIGGEKKENPGGNGEGAFV